MDDLGAPGAPATVVALDEQDDPPVDLARWAAFAEQVLAAVGVGDTEVALTFVDEATIAGLKRDHLDGDGAPTDVLSFPLDDPAEAHGPTGGVPSLLGDVVICPAVAARQASAHAGSLDDELALLLVHGLLHLLGMDHARPGDRRDMQARERRLLDELHGPLAGDPWRDPIGEAS